jgi:uncharacterized protein YkwD
MIPAPPVVQSSRPFGSYAADLRTKLNAYMVAHGRPALVTNDTLLAVASQYADFVLTTRWWNTHPKNLIHKDAKCRDMGDRARAAGYNATRIGEFVTWGPTSWSVDQMFDDLKAQFGGPGFEDPADPAYGFVAVGVSCARSDSDIACVIMLGSSP